MVVILLSLQASFSSRPGAALARFLCLIAPSKCTHVQNMHTLLSDQGCSMPGNAYSDDDYYKGRG